VNILHHRLLSPPLVFKLIRGEVAQRGVDALVDVDLIEKSSQLTASIIVTLIVRQVNFLFFAASDKALGIAVLPGGTRLGHADLSVNLLQPLNVGQGCVLPPWAERWISGV